jgi:uncharacterized protein (DUF2236 family)
MFFGAGRALMMQVAHPAVAQAVHDHSDFRRDPFGRLLGTLEAVNAVVYGPADLAERMGTAISRVHDRVTGPGYRANDPENLAWVQATLTDAALWAYEQLVGRLEARDADAFCADMARVGEVFGCPLRAQPSSRGELAEYVAEQVASFPVTGPGRAVAADVVRPRVAAPLGLPLGLPLGRPLSLPLDIPLAPVLAVHGLVAVGATPQPVRDLLGLGWGPRPQRRFEQVLSVARVVMRMTPRSVRLAPGRINDRVLQARARHHLGRYADAA